MSYRNRSRLTFSLLAASLALCCAFIAMLAGLGNRRGWWDFHTGLIILKWAAYAESMVVIVSVIGVILSAIKKRKNALAFFLIGVVICILALGVPLSMWLTAHHVPSIHDITTDTENPPEFAAILKVRRNASNPVAYGGPDVAAQQHKAYPDIMPLMLALPPVKAFDRAVAVASKMGWEIVNVNLANGIIEATDTTFWFGFKDDVAIRISPDAKGSRIDVRSVSRVGVSDIGTNAKRIRNYLRVLKAIAQEG